MGYDNRRLHKVGYFAELMSTNRDVCALDEGFELRPVGKAVGASEDSARRPMRSDQYGAAFS